MLLFVKNDSPPCKSLRQQAWLNRLFHSLLAQPPQGCTRGLSVASENGGNCHRWSEPIMHCEKRETSPIIRPTNHKMVVPVKGGGGACLIVPWHSIAIRLGPCISLPGWTSGVNDQACRTSCSLKPPALPLIYMAIYIHAFYILSMLRLLRIFIALFLDSGRFLTAFRCKCCHSWNSHCLSYS